MPSSADQDALKVMEGRVWEVAVARQLSVQLLSYTVSLWRRRKFNPTQRGGREMAVSTSWSVGWEWDRHVN